MLCCACFPSISLKMLEKGRKVADSDVGHPTPGQRLPTAASLGESARKPPTVTIGLLVRYLTPYADAAAPWMLCAVACPTYIAAPMSSQRACDIRTYQRPCGGGNTVYFKLTAFLPWPPLGKHMLASVLPNLRAMPGTAVSLCVVFASLNTSHFPLSLTTHHAGDRETSGILSGHAVRCGAGLPCFQHVLSMTPSRCL